MSRTPLQQILGPVNQAEFLDQYWQKRSLLVQNRSEPWPFTFDRESFFSAIPKCRELAMIFENDEGQHKELGIEAEQARHIYEAGHTLCATRVNYGNPGLQRYLDALKEAMPGGEFHMQSYLSPNGSGFGVHYDCQSVWVLQLEGTKRWQYADQPAVKNPATNCIFPLEKEEFAFPWYTVQRPELSTFNEVVLEPGDLLYLPPGAWHKTVADGYSLSITLGYEQERASVLISDLIMQGIWYDEDSRRRLPFVPDSGGGKTKSEAELRNTFQAALSTLRERINRLSTDRLMDMWHAQVEAEQKKRQQCACGTDSESSSVFAALFGQSSTNGKAHKNGSSPKNGSSHSNGKVAATK